MGKIVFALMLVIVLFASEESTIRGSEARMCQSKGHALSCVVDANCRSSCEKQGFTDGKCDGLRRKCTCYKPC